MRGSIALYGWLGNIQMGNVAWENVAGYSAISRRGQARDADAGMAFVADVHANQQGGDLLDNAGVFELASIDGSDAGNL